PFTFYYYGNGYDNVNICSNGFINFGTGTYDFSSFAIPDGSAPEGMVALFWQDLIVSSGTIRYQTLGTTPNRKFVVSFNAIPDISGYGNHSGQIILYETLNYIDILINSNPASYDNVTCGVQDLTGSNGIAAPGHNGVPFSATREAWRFTGVPTSGYTYAWAPATGMSSTTSSSPTASSISGSTTFTVTVTETASGCVDTGIAVVNTGTLPGTIAASDTVCSGATATLTFTGPGGATATYTINGASPTNVTLDGSGTATVTTSALTSTTRYELTTITSGTCVQSITGQVRDIYVRPAAGTISGTPTLCTSSSFTFTNPTAGGTWSSSSTARATVNPSTGVVYGVSAGSATISYAFGSCPAATLNISVVGAPAAITPTAATTICSGTTFTLASTTTGGVWTSASRSVATVDSTTGIVTGLSAGSAVITYSTGCGTPRTKTITVTTAPAAITGSGFGAPPTAICTLSTTTFTNAVSGGTWSISTTSLGSVGSGTGIFNSGTAVGALTVSYSIGTCIATAALNIGNRSPGPITGASSVCALASTTLADTTLYGVWSSSDTTLATIDAASGTVTGVNYGTPTITYSNGCGSPVTRSITVNGSIPVVSADTICSGSTLNLRASVAATGSYSWSGPAGYTSTLLSPSISSASTARAGTYVLTVTSSVGSCVTSARAFAVIDTLPTASASVSPATICPGGSATITNAVSGPTGLVMHAIPYARIAVPTGSAGPSGDDAQVNVTLPFTFRYFGTDYTTVRICTNGFINFGSVSTLYASEAIPSSTAPLNMIALFWQDLYANTGDIRYTTLGTTPNRRFIVSFNDVADVAGSSTNTGQVVLYETSNMIDIYV
ncbi:MAG: hypothetical protein EBZ77_10065, partial [Chitinophagia bacterium]|nr:hypothetical protein [Chitinophagia bacterium]